MLIFGELIWVYNPLMYKPHKSNKLKLHTMQMSILHSFTLFKLKSLIESLDLVGLLKSFLRKNDLKFFLILK